MGFLILKSWDFALHARTCKREWDLGPNVNRPLECNRCGPSVSCMKMPKNMLTNVLNSKFLGPKPYCKSTLRATSYTRLRARDHCTSSTLIGGKGGVCPSLLHTMLDGATEYVDARWM